MRRKRAMPSRRRRALRWVAVLCLLVAVCHFTDIYVLTLGRTLERQDRYWLTGPTELDEVVRDPYCREGVGVVTASWNDRVVSLGLSSWMPLRGWLPGFSWPVERTGGAVDAVAVYYSWDADSSRYPYVVYGVVNDPSVTEVRLTYRERPRLTDNWGPVRELPIELRTGDDGHRYFLVNFTANGICGFTYTAAGRNGVADGEIVFMSLAYDWPDM